MGSEDNPYIALIESTLKEITSCDIHKDTKIIAERAFGWCENLKTVTIPSDTSLTHITGDAFFQCNSLKYNTYDNGKYFGNDANPYIVFMAATSEKITSCDIHEDTRIIYCDAFQHCRNLQTVTMPHDSSLKSIGNYAFNNCEKLENFTVPNGVISIGKNAFCECVSLKSVEIPSSVTCIEDCSFSSCRSLKSITISKNVTRIGRGAFYGCSSLKSITIPNGVTSICEETFYNCGDLKTVIISSNSLLESIGEYAFKNCHVNLTFVCDEASYAEEYAKENSIKVEYIKEVSVETEPESGIFAPTTNTAESNAINSPANNNGGHMNISDDDVFDDEIQENEENSGAVVIVIVIVATVAIVGVVIFVLKRKKQSI